MRSALLVIVVLGVYAADSSAAVRSFFNQRTDRSYVDPIHQVSRSGDNLEAVILAEISKAKKTVWVAVQELRLPSIAKLLVQKKKAGVDVRVILEDSYNHDILSRPRSGDGTEQDNPDGTYDAIRLRELFALTDANGDGKLSSAEISNGDAVFILKQGKVTVHDDTLDGSQGSGLMHHKFLVIDNKTVVMSSANFTASCIHGDKLVSSSRGNANAMMVVDSTELAQLFSEEHQEMWSGRFGVQKRFRGPKTVSIGTKKITVQFSPTSRVLGWNASTNSLIANTIKSASSSVKAALFVFSEQKIADAMQGVQNRADISVVVDPKFAYRPYSEVLDLLGVFILDPMTCRTEYGNAPWRKPLEKVGVPSLNRGDVLHHKFAVVDGKKVIFGSHNWSESANVMNDEFELVVQDSVTANNFSREFTRVSSRARWGVPAHLKYKMQDLEAGCARR